MHVTRDMGQKWHNQCTMAMKEVGFSVRTVSTCHFYHEKWDMRGLDHGDDFAAVGVKNNLKQIAEFRAKKFKINVAMTGREHLEPLEGDEEPQEEERRQSEMRA